MTRQEELTELLIRCNEAYYNHSDPIISDAEYDQFMDELKEQEAISGFVPPYSPTQRVGQN